MKMKNYFEISFKVIVIIALAILVAKELGNESIAYVDSERLVNGYKGIKVAREEFEAKSSVWNANLDSLRVELEEEFEKFEMERATLNKSEIDRMEKLLQSKQQIYTNYQQVVREKMQGENALITKNVMVKINDFIKEFGKERGLKMILSSNVVYANQSLDITDEVLDGLNQSK